MLRHLTLVLLMAAVMFLAALPHASMAEGSSGMSGACLYHQAGSTEHHDTSGQCGQTGHSMSEACAIACVGPMVPVLQSVGMRPAEFARVALWFPSALVLRGRVTDPDDRPPRSI